MQVMQESLQDPFLADTYQDLPKLKYICGLYYLFQICDVNILFFSSARLNSWSTKWSRNNISFFQMG